MSKKPSIHERLDAMPLLSYANPEVKKTFHRLARSVLKQLANDLRLAKGSYEIRSNMGGIAVSGEITLHSESLYVQISQWSWTTPSRDTVTSVLFRSCKGRKDYVGDRNNFCSVTDLISEDMILRLHELGGLDYAVAS